jgi:hypothetical protein
VQRLHQSHHQQMLSLFMPQPPRPHPNTPPQHSPNRKRQHRPPQQLRQQLQQQHMPAQGTGSRAPCCCPTCCRCQAACMWR